MPVTELLLLLAALLTPWALGYLMVRRWLPGGSPGQGLRHHGVLASQLGYGFFLGYAITAALLWLAGALLGHFVFYPLLGALLLACVVLVLLPTHPGRQWLPRSVSEREAASTRWLAGLFLLAIILHLAFALLEILHRPVFPWDAWLNWMYRAKIWYFSNAPLPFAEPGTWAAGERLAPYNVDGAHYPPLVPLVATWSALALGRWSETLINLPTFLAGVALALGFYGQCRASMPRVWALAACYALVSLPLLGAHLALAGQADIWLSAYAGLGILAVLGARSDPVGRNHQKGRSDPNARIREKGRSVALGLLLCAIGVTIKVEGALWLLLALLLLASARAGTVAVWISLAALLALLAASWLLPTSALQELVARLEQWWPQLARGVGQGLTERQLGDDYLQNYLLGGSWHLAAWVSAACFAILLLTRGWQRGALAQLATVFFALQASALILIFSFSRNGAWAEDWTAINRLPLQLVAVHVYLWFRLIRALPLWQLTKLTAGQGLAGLALALTCFGCVLGGSAVLLGGADSGERVFAADTLRAVVGGGVTRNGELWLERYQDGLAIASSGSVRLSLAEFPLVTVHTGGGNQRAASFFVRGADDPTDLKSLDLPARGTAVLDLRKTLARDDQLIEFGVLSYRDSAGRPLSLGPVTFSSATPGRLLHKFWSDWSTVDYWSLKSVHWLPAGRADALLPLPLAGALALLLLAALLSLRYRGRREAIVPLLLPALLVVWLILDARWISNLLHQSQRSLQDYPLLAATNHAFSDDAQISAVVADALAASADAQAPLLVVGQREDLRYQLLRAKYHAAPRPSLVPEPATAAAFKAGDQLLLLGSAYESRDLLLDRLGSLGRELAREGLSLSDPILGERSAFASVSRITDD